MTPIAITLATVCVIAATYAVHQALQARASARRARGDR